MELNPVLLAAGVVAAAAPVLLATLGETLSERAGTINLSLDGTILLSAMTAFVVALASGSLTAGFVAGAVVGGATAALVSLFGIYLGQSQVAVGFVLTLTARDLAYFLGNPYARVPGPSLAPVPIPFLCDLPLIGPILFRHSLPVYGSMLLVGLCWGYLYRTRAGRVLRAVGENPAAVFARGFDPRRLQMAYTVVGGMLVGLAGATFSLATKPGWGRPQGAEGTGWIALALVIFGGWHPVRAAAGAYLFAFLQIMGIHLQGWFPSVPAQVFQVAPFPLMIFTLLLITVSQNETVVRLTLGFPRLQRFLGRLAGAAPAALGKPYRPD